MRESDVDNLFLRFRDGGDPGHLARVFDQTAPELLRIARHVAHGPQEAEDLLQATFLTALEKADRFEAGRRVRPWLVGILVRHAHRARRRGRRSLEVERVESRSPRDPGDVAEERELQEEVERALSALPAHVREVVEPRVREGAGGPEIARRVGRQPETVRVQLSRGLSVLRGLLPVGLAGGLLLSATARRSLAAVRQRVLEHASASGGVAATATSTGLFSLGGALVANKVLVFGAAVGLLVVASSLLWSDGEPSEPVVTSVRAPAPGTPDRPGARTEIERDVVPAAAPHAPVTPAGPASPAAAPAQETASVTGRLVVTGAPLAGTEVALLRVRVEEFLGGMRATLHGMPDAPLVEVGRAVTDGDGRFTIGAAPTWSVLALGVDLGGPRATLRVLETTPAPGATLALGDVELGPVTALVGVVVDEDGDPVAGASVRAVLSPIPLATVGAQHLRPDARILRPGTADALGPVTPLPGWIGDWWGRLPIPTTTTDAAGRFELPGVPRGLASVVVQRDGFVSLSKVAPTGVSVARDLGELTLERGRTFVGRVVDGAGAPLAGVEAVAGIHFALVGLGVGRPVGVTDAEGRFEVPGLPEFGDVVVALRQDRRDDWSLVEVGDEEEAELVLAGRATLSVELEGDVAALGERLEVSVQRASAPWSIAASGAPIRRAATVDGRRFVFPDLAVGAYVVLVALDGAARAYRVPVPPEGTTLPVALPTPTSLEVRVVDAATKAPVGGVSVKLEKLLVASDAPVEGVTDEAGAVALGPVAFDGVEYGVEPQLVCVHPEYGRVVTPIEEAPDGVLTIRLRNPGRVEGVVAIAGDPPPESLLVLAYEDDGFLGFLNGTPWLATTLPRGDFSFPALPPGEYIYRVYPRFFTGDALAVGPKVNAPPDSIARGEFSVRAGEVTEVEVNAVTKESALACRIVGRVTLDGRPVEEARVYVYPMSRFARTGARGGNAVTDVTGAFEIGGLPPGMASVDVKLWHRKENTVDIEEVFSRVIDLRTGGVTRVDVALESNDVDVSVVDAAGAAVSRVEVVLQGTGEQSDGFYARARTDAEGYAHVKVFHRGSYRIDAFSPYHGAAGSTTKVPTPGPIRLTLDAGVACKGTFTIPEEWVPEQGGWFPFLEFVYRPEGETVQRQVLADTDDWAFDVKGIPAGPVEVRFLHQKRASRPIEVVLPAAGAAALRLEFEEE